MKKKDTILGRVISNAVIAMVVLIFNIIPFLSMAQITLPLPKPTYTLIGPGEYQTVYADNTGTLWGGGNINNRGGNQTGTEGIPVLVQGVGSMKFSKVAGGLHGFGSNLRYTCGTPITSLLIKHLYSVVASNSDWTSYLNHVQQYDAGSNTVSVSSSFVIGKQYGSFYFQGKIAEVLIYSSAVSSGNRDAISTNINSYYTIF